MLFTGGGKSPSDKDGDTLNKTETKTETAAVRSDDISIFHPKIVLLSLALSGGMLASYRLYRTIFLRIPTSLDIPTYYFRRKYARGVVSSVGDGDNFHFFHTPGGILAGWGWLRHPPTTRKLLKNQTWSVRLCGIDAPERSHFGKPAQPFSEESLIWLRNYLLNKKCRVKPLRIDQYNRVVGKVLIKKYGFITRDVSEEMLKNGIAIVYENKNGSEFDGQEHIYRRCEAKARRKGKGLWGLKGKLQTPGEYKKMYK